MDNTFIKIGQVVRKENRAKYHPMVSSRNLIEKDKVKVNIVTHELHVDMDNNTVIIGTPEALPAKLEVIRFALSSADSKSKYLTGSCVIKKAEVQNQLSFETFEEKYIKEYPKILTQDSFIYKFRKLVEGYANDISNILLQYNDDKSIEYIALIVNVTYQGNRDSAHAFVECMNEMDEMFLQASYVEDKGYVFTNAFYSMFNYGKFETSGVQTMYDNSIPYFNKEDFLSLYYAKNIYTQKSYGIDSKAKYSISIFPNYDGLTMNDIETFLFKGKDIFNFDLICDEIENFITRRVKRNPKEKILIPILLKFDLYYRYELGKAGSQNMLRLNGIRYSQLLKIRNRMNGAYKLIYDKDKMPEKFLYGILYAIYQDYNKSSERYVTTIFKTLQRIYQEKYEVPQEAEFCLLDRAQFVARKGDEKEFKDTWNNLFNIYKFLKTMENSKFVSELTENLSYKLGVELAKFEAGWRNDRVNLKRTIEQFTGNISRTVYSMKDIMDYYNDLVARMARNKVYCGNHNDLIFLLHTIQDNKFEKNTFIFGYNTEKCTYKPKKTDTPENVAVAEIPTKNGELLEPDENNH